jgi:hypothetical protein
MAGLIRSPGTATFTNSSATVTGSGTNWTATARAGMLIRSKSNNVWYEILTVGSDTSITLVESWSGTTGSSGFEILPWFSGQDDAPTTLSAQIGVFLAAYASLFSVSGNDKTLTLNKGAAGNNGGVVLQVAGVGYFRVGIFGDGTFRIERSADGTNWTSAIAIDRSTGAMTFTGAMTVSGAFSATGVANFGDGGGSADVNLIKNLNSQRFISMRNLSSGSSASIGFLFGDDATAARGAMVAHSSNRTDLAGANSLNFGTYGPNAVGFFTANTLRASFDSTGHFKPGADGAYNLGASGLRWANLYCANGTIQTSDEKEKTPLRRLNEAERRVARKIFGMIGIFQWLSAVAAKGEGARLHVGLTAQSLRRAFEEEDLDPARYGVWCRDPIIEMAKKTRKVMAEKTEEHWVEETEIKIVNGAPVMKKERRKEERVVGRLALVKDENGVQVMNRGLPMMHLVPEMVEVEEEYFEAVDTGEFREGIRPDQLYAFVTAGAADFVQEQQAEIADLSARLAAIEATA